MTRSATPPGLKKYMALERRTRRERPTQRIFCSADIGRFVAEIRRGLNIRQVDLAQRAQVGRHWLMALEQGKQSCEVELVLRTLAALGFEMILSPTTPVPPWIVVAQQTAAARHREVRERRNQRRQGRRELERLNRMNTNVSRVMLDLE